MNRKRTNRITLAVVIALAVAAGISCRGHAKNVERHNGLFPIKTISMKDCGLAPWLVTERLGFFKQEGIEIVYTGETQPALVMPSILNGNNDVSGDHPTGLAVARAGGAKITGVVRSTIDPAPDLDPRLRHMFWYVNPKKYPNVKTFADLKKLPGRLKFSTITVNICVDFLTNKLAEKYGVPLDKIEWVTMPDIQAIQALKQGLVDIAGVHPPFYKGMDDAGAVKIADSLETGLGPAAGVSYYYFRDDFISRYPGVVRGFVRAIGRGQAWIDAHPELTAKWVSEAIGVPVTASHYYPLHNDVLESEIDPWIADLEKHKVLPRGKIHAADLVTHRFETHELFTWN